MIKKRESKPDRTVGRGSRPSAIALSILLHTGLFAALLIGLQAPITSQIIAAGEGEGGEGGGGAIEVGVADASAILGFARPEPVSFIGDENTPVNNARVETSKPVEVEPEEVLPSTDKEALRPDTLKTDRPVVSQQERIFTGKEERGRSQSETAQVGRSYGSAAPAISGGVGIGSGGGFGVGTGLPGGSEYGRRIQRILSRNFNPPSVEPGQPQYVVILVRISREGRILSLSNGRVSPAYFKQRSANALVNSAAERAVIASDPLPSFPAGFLSGAQDAVAEVWFRCPN